MAKVANSIIALGRGAVVIIGYGDFRQRQGSAANRGNVSSPIVAIRKVCHVIFFLLLFCDNNLLYHYSVTLSLSYVYIGISEEM